MQQSNSSSLFIQHLSQLITISSELEKALIANTTKIRVEKNTDLVGINERSDHLYFIEKGLIRGYYFYNGKEITNWFAQEEEFATCFYSFVANKPSFECIETLEDCELVSIPLKTLQTLYLDFPETERIGRIITENYYIKLEERVLNIQFKTAKERYQKLITKKPLLLQRVSLGQIASYLGITQETLSRIRAEV